jgi:hypothetical protein
MLGTINAALVSQGMDEVPIGVDTPEYRVLTQNWPSIVEAELEDGNYSFTKKEATLLTRSPGKFGFDDGFAVPSAALHVRHLWVEENGERYDARWVQDGAHVYLDSPTGCIIEYLETADPSVWSANFTRGVQYRLEAVLLRAVKEEAREAANMEQQAEIYFQRARTNSSKSRSAVPPLKPSRIALARFSRGR